MMNGRPIVNGRTMVGGEWYVNERPIVNGRLMVQNLHISYSHFKVVNGTIHLRLVIMQMSVQKKLLLGEMVFYW